MNEYLPQLLAFPPHPPPTQPLTNVQYDAQIQALLQVLNRIPAKVLTGGVNGGDDLLNVSFGVATISLTYDGGAPSSP